ncbi:MAG: HAMP domain-containing histidine kinase [Alphaproteobacteria bacterium]|nr:HAMP domain-containing histidine kinase [Alphaproteobacteria bacterium]
MAALLKNSETSSPHRIRVDRLSLKLVSIIVGFLVLAELLILIPALPRFHLSEMQSRMRELSFMAELRLIEEKGSYTPTPLPAGCGISLLSPDGKELWFGNPATVEAAMGVTPLPWSEDFIDQLGLALRAITATSSEPVIYQVNTENLMQAGVHTQLKQHFTLDLIMPKNIISAPIRIFLIESLGLVLFFAILIGVPVAFFVERRVIRPLKRLAEDMTEFAHDPYQPRAGGIYAEGEAIISEAQQALGKLQQATRNELLQRDKLASMGEAVAKINHDMRNVLSSAVLLSDRLEQADDPRVQKSGAVVSKAIQRAVVLCGQMLTFLKTPGQIAPKQLDIRTIIDECADEIGITISYEGPDQLVVDSGYFFRLLHNLVNNAHNAGATAITIAIWKAGSYAVMDIADNGNGMDDETKALIFKPFAGSTRGSTGLGLCISRDIAIAHGGDLKLTRSNENGSEFRLRLPVEVLGEMTRNRFWSS